MKEPFVNQLQDSVKSTKDDGWEMTRVVLVAALSGETLGTAKALFVREGCSNSELDVKILQEAMRVFS